MGKTAFACSLLAAFMVAIPLRAEVNARLSHSSIGQNEPVTLTLESDGAATAAPDLSPLEREFHIVNRSSRHSMRSFNGRRSQSTTITLTLIPMRGGELTIPAIAFGQERSQPLRLSVTPVADGGLDPGLPDYQRLDDQGSVSPEPAPFPFPLPQQGFPQGFGTAPPFSTPQDWGGMQGMPGWNGFSNWSGGGLGMPAETPPDAKGWQAQPEEEAAAPEPKVEETTYWPWITALLLTGWIVTTVLLGWRTRRGPATRPAAAAAAKMPKAAPDRGQQASQAVEGIRQAYEQGDALAAKAALLRWAAIQWPDNPPTNLSRLAAHCPGTVQRPILKLDESLYSPEPVAWNREPVWEQLSALKPDEPDHSIPPAASQAHGSP